MNFRTALIITSIFLFFTFQLFGQTLKKYHVELKWNKVQNIGEKNARIKIMHFEGAMGSEQYPELPAYFHQIRLASDSKVNVRLENTKYEVLEDSIRGLFPSLEQIGNEFEITTTIYAAQGDYTANIFVESLRKRNNKIERLISFDLICTLNSLRKISGSTKGKTYANHSVLSKGQWYKIRISKDGIYKVNASEFSSMGFSLSGVSLDQVKVYGNGGGMLPEANSSYYPDDLQENAIQVIDANNNGSFDNSDYILFYGQGPNPWKYSTTTKRFHHSKHLYDSYAYYFLTIDKAGNGKRIQTETAPSQNPNTYVTSFVDFAFHERDSINLIKSGKQWYGEEFNILLNYNFNFSFPNIDPTSRTYIRTNAIARSFSTSSMTYNINGKQLVSSFSPVINHYLAPYANSATDTMTFYTSGNSISVNASYSKPTSSSSAWLNFIELNVVRKLTMVGNQMAFRNTKCIASGNITEFTLENANNNTKIWDVTNINEPKNIPTSLNAKTLKFKLTTDSLRNFIAHSGGYYSISKVGPVKNQDLHELLAVDYVILYHPKFKAEAEELADFHRNRSSLNVLTLEAATIYNEFSSGAIDISAIRNFMRMLYDKAGGNLQFMPRYLLLFGDASYDYKNRLKNNTNYILTYESYESLSPTASFATDDYFGLLDNNEGYNANGNLDVGIGRFMVRSKKEARDLLNKIYRYTAKPGIDTSNNASCSNGSGGVSNLADWRNITCFIGDDEDDNIHLQQADYLANYVWNNYPVYNIDKIFFDAYPQIITPGGQRYPDVKSAIKNRVEKGALIINYTGHGGEEGWAHESVLEISDINGWSNLNNMPAFVTATCEFSRYDDPNRVSAGEIVLLNPKGGGIALLTTSRVTYSSTNFVLSKVVYQNIFKKINGEYLNLGDIMRISKVGAGSVNANKNFILLGDPALPLSYPLKDVKTTAIRDALSHQLVDTLKALSKITIEGEVQDMGVLMNNYNGYIYPTIYDKVKAYSTLGNDPKSHVTTFYLQKSIIYKGKAKVKNGKFSFTFVVPKDISYKLGNGKISYYTHNGEIDANGYMDSLLIGGSLSNADIDTEGPEIRLFMNDTNFIIGGITDENPSLLAFVFDEHGINTVGNGIGHDIVAILDENSVNPIILNDFYESTLDDYKRGKISYPFSKLAIGNHTLSLKVWDVYNNSSTARTEFLVADGEEMALDHLLNAPNPFIDYTSFIFEHNQSCETMNVEIDIYNTAGRLVKTIRAEVNATGYRVGPRQLTWNGKSEDGTKLTSGLYIYRLKAQNQNGQWIEKSSKLILLKEH